MIRVHGSRWRKAVREPGAEAGVAEETIRRLETLRLVRITADGVIPLPLCGRYGAADGTIEKPGVTSL
jgi:hypothetical protein